GRSLALRPNPHYRSSRAPARRGDPHERGAASRHQPGARGLLPSDPQYEPAVADVDDPARPRTVALGLPGARFVVRGDSAQRQALGPAGASHQSQPCHLAQNSRSSARVRRKLVHVCVYRRHVERAPQPDWRATPDVSDSTAGSVGHRRGSGLRVYGITLQARKALMRWKVLLSAPYMQPVVEQYRPRFEAQGIDLVVPPVSERLEEAELLQYIGDIDGVICGDDRFTERVLLSAPKLKVISKWGTGIDSIDRQAWQRLGIRLCNTPKAFSE